MKARIVKVSEGQYNIVSKGGIVIGFVYEGEGFVEDGRRHRDFYSRGGEGALDPAIDWKLNNAGTLTQLRSYLPHMVADLDFCTEGCGRITTAGTCCTVCMQPLPELPICIVPSCTDIAYDDTLCFDHFRAAAAEQDQQVPAGCPECGNPGTVHTWNCPTRRIEPERVNPVARVACAIADATDLFYDEAKATAEELIEVWQAMRMNVRHAKSGHVQNACVSASLTFRGHIEKRYGDEVMHAVDVACILATPRG